MLLLYYVYFKNICFVRHMFAITEIKFEEEKQLTDESLIDQ